MPCTRPPCTWPATISGLTMLPMSSTQTYLRIFVSPVSVSTSIAHRWVPCGKLKLTGSKVASESIVGSIPSGRLWAAKTAVAISPIAMPWSVPRTEKRPAANSMSSTEASSRWAAIGFAFSMTLSAAFTSASPPTTSEREP